LFDFCEVGAALLVLKPTRGMQQPLTILAGPAGAAASAAAAAALEEDAVK
jgi:hypothetical protein